MGALDLEAERGSGAGGPGTARRATQDQSPIVGTDLKIPAGEVDLHLFQVVGLVKIGQENFQRGRLAAGLQLDVSPGIVRQGTEERIRLPAVYDRLLGIGIHHRKVETGAVLRAIIILFFHKRIEASRLRLVGAETRLSDSTELAEVSSKPLRAARRELTFRVWLH